MKSDITHLPKSRVKLAITLTAEEFQDYYNGAKQHLATHLTVPGFRRGKVPAALAEQQLGSTAIRAEALEQAIPQAYSDAILEHQLHPLHQPEVTLTDAKEGVAFMAEVDVLPKVTLKNWQTIKIKKSMPEVIDDAALDRVLQQLQKERAELKEANRPIQTRDFASISFDGSVDGVIQENMHSDHHPLIVGEGRLIPGFEDHLIGMKPNDTVEFDITFPKDYHEKSLAHKKAHFKVTLHEMKEVILPELNDAFAGNFGKETLDSLKKTVREQLVEEAAKATQQKDEEAILAELIKRTEVDIPAILLERETDHFVEHFKERLQMDDLQFTQYLERDNKTLADFRKEAHPQAEKNAIIGLALGEIMQQEKINPEDKESVRNVLNLLLEKATV